MLKDDALLDLFSRAAETLGLPMVDGFEVDESLRFLVEYITDQGPLIVVHTCATNGVGRYRLAQTGCTLGREGFDGSDVTTILEGVRELAAFNLHRLVDPQGLTIVDPPVSKMPSGG